MPNRKYPVGESPWWIGRVGLNKGTRCYVRVFHFLNAQYGIDDIKRRRLKISTISDLNDPFELLSIDLSNRNLRKAFLATKEQMSKNRGILCFSMKWSNPVLWSHYADKHRGLCLGFDIPDDHLVPVSYTAKRLVKEAKQLSGTSSINEETMLKFLSTKYAHWKYESEARRFLELEDKDPESALYFADFSEKLKLVQIIVGTRSSVSRSEVSEALGIHQNGVRVFKARLAFRSFRVVRNRNEALWG